MPSLEDQHAHEQAFLNLLAYAEHGGRDVADPFHMLYGGTYFSDTSRHPNKPISRWGHTSTAAGAYMIDFRTYEEAVRLGVAHDFSPASQAAIALNILQRKGALSDIWAGNLDAAFATLHRRWPSLPGGSQQEIDFKQARSYFSTQLRALQR